MPSSDAFVAPLAASPLEALCLGCGLCCDGTLFAQVPVSAEEAQALVGHAPTVETRNGRSALRLRCTALVGTCCSSYDARPSGCRGFVCAVGKRLEAGTLTAAEARATLEGLKADVAATGAALGLTGAVMPQVRDALSAPVPQHSDAELARARATTALVRTTLLGWS